MYMLIILCSYYSINAKKSKEMYNIFQKYFDIRKNKIMLPCNT